MNTVLKDHELIAHNTATASTNRIHDDEVARQYGFDGGLVPGVDVYAYLTHPLVEGWGVGWLEHGALRARFLQPVYDGRKTVVTARETGDGVADVEVRDDTGALCATGAARRHVAAPAPSVDAFPPAPVPEERTAAEPDAMAALVTLGSIGATFRAEKAIEYLAEVREDLPVYVERGIAHPGWLLRWANWILAANVDLGPWIHVESDVVHHGLVRDGEHVEVRGRVARLFERKGHAFVELDLVLLTDGTRIVQTTRHTAIYRPRVQR